MRGEGIPRGFGDAARDTIPLTPNPSPPSTGERGEDWRGVSVKGDLPLQGLLFECPSLLDGRSLLAVRRRRMKAVGRHRAGALGLRYIPLPLYSGGEGQG